MSKEKKPTALQPVMYTHAWWDILHKRKDEIEKRVTEVVNEMTADLDKEIDEQLRMMLTETYRFWR